MKSVLTASVPDAARVGATIRDLRRQRHLTQTELGRRIGMRPGPMNNIEQGRSLPSTPVLCRLAAELEVPVDVLLARPVPYVRASGFGEAAVREVGSEYVTVPAAHPVQLLPAQQPYTPEMLALLDDLVRAYLTLEDRCGATKRAAIPLCLAMPHTEMGIEDLVMRVRALLGIGPGVIFDYLELFENAGLRIIFAPLPDGVESAACHDPASENAFLFVSSTGRPTAEHQLFLLVRELGRIYCHTGQVQQVAGRSKSLDAEHVAAKFTAFFLMPAEAVHATVRQVGVKYDDWTWEMLLRLKHRFGVSAEAFLYRLDELELIAPKLRAELKARILAYYDATHHTEPGGSRRILSPNGRLGDLLLAATGEECVTVRRILTRHGVKAGLTPHPLRRERET